MKHRVSQGKKFCGNCWYHDTYQYPSAVFCEYRYLNREDPVVDVLSCCSHWKFEQETCFCVEDAKKVAHVES